jgi:hypothetical protein
MKMLKVAETAVDQLGRGRGGGRSEIALLDQDHGKTSTGGVASDAAAVNPTADDGEVEFAHRHFRPILIGER